VVVRTRCAPKRLRGRAALCSKTVPFNETLLEMQKKKRSSAEPRRLYGDEKALKREEGRGKVMRERESLNLRRKKFCLDGGLSSSSEGKRATEEETGEKQFLRESKITGPSILCMLDRMTILKGSIYTV